MGKFDGKDQHFADIFFGRRNAAVQPGKKVTAQAKEPENPDGAKTLPWETPVVVPSHDYGSTQKKLFAAVNEKIKKYRVAGAEITEDSYRIHEVEKLANGATAVRYAKAVYSISLPTSHPNVKRTVRTAAYYDATKRDPVSVDAVLYTEKDEPLPFVSTTFDRLALEIPDEPSAKGSLVVVTEEGRYEELPSKNIAAVTEALAAKGIAVNARWIDRVYGPRFGCMCRLVDVPAERTAEVIEAIKEVDASQDAKESDYDKRADEKKKPGYKVLPYDDRAGEKGNAFSNWIEQDYDDRASQKGKDSAVAAAYGTEAAMQRTEKRKVLSSWPVKAKDAPKATDDPYEGTADRKPGEEYQYPDADTRKPSSLALDKPEGIEGEATAPRATDDPYKGEGESVGPKFKIPQDPQKASNLAVKPEVTKDESGAPKATEDPYEGQGQHQTTFKTAPAPASKEAPSLSPAAKEKRERAARILADIRRLRALNAAARAKAAKA